MNIVRVIKITATATAISVAIVMASMVATMAPASAKGATRCTAIAAPRGADFTPVRGFLGRWTVRGNLVGWSVHEDGAIYRSAYCAMGTLAR